MGINASALSAEKPKALLLPGQPFPMGALLGVCYKSSTAASPDGQEQAASLQRSWWEAQGGRERGR